MAERASSILMIRPAAFGFNPETAVNNFFQSSTVRSASELQALASAEFDNMVDLLRSKGIEVMVVEDTLNPPKPDAIFPNNWISTSPDGTISVFPMYAYNRRPEKRDDIIQLLQNKYVVSRIYDWSEYEVEGQFLEGTGSMVIDHLNKMIYACLSPRTHSAMIERFASTKGYTALGFKAVDREGRPVYHTNVMMCVGDSFALVCLDSIPDEDEKFALHHLLTSSDKKIITIDLDQMHSFAGNMLQLINKENKSIIVLSQTARNSLTNEQIESLSVHGELLPIPVPVIEEVEGGSVRCMIAEIFLEKRNSDF